MKNNRIDIFVFGMCIAIVLLIIQAFFVKNKIDNIELYFSNIVANSDYIEVIDYSFQDMERIIFFLKDVIEDQHGIIIEFNEDFPTIKKEIEVENVTL